MITGPAVALVALAFSVGLLWKGADWTVGAAVNIARHFGMSKLTVGLTVVALGTSAPEFLVTVIAAIGDKPDISVGNVVGSNIFNTGLILGACAVLWTVPTSRPLIRRDIPLLMLGTGLVIFFTRDAWLGRFDGLILVGLLVAYLGYLLATGTHRVEVDDDEAPLGRACLVLAGGLAAICGGAHLMVESAVSLAQTLGIPQWKIALTVVAGGTSLPEFATSLAAARRGHAEIVLGSLIGSDIFNLLGVLGLAASIHPLAIEPAAMHGLWLMLGAVALLWGTAVFG